VINANIASFNAIPGGTNQFKWKAFLSSNGSQKVEIDTISVNSYNPNPNLSVTNIDNDADNTVSTNQIVRYTTSINNTGANASGISATVGINSNFNAPYNFSYSNCGSPSSSFTIPTLSFSNISVNSGQTCSISYDVQVKSSASSGATITNSFDVSAAIE